MTAQQGHNHFGAYANAAALPDDTAEPTLKAGDLAYAISEAKTYTCTNPSTPTWAAGGGVFEADVANNELQPVTGEAGRGFVVGSQTMEDSGAAGDARMFFDKQSKVGAFRAGSADAIQWNISSRGENSAAFGANCTAFGARSFAWGYRCEAIASNSYAGGSNCRAGPYASNSHAEGNGTYAYGSNSHAEGQGTYAYCTGSHVEGLYTSTSGSTYYGLHAEGLYTVARNTGAHAEGIYTTASGSASHAEGGNTTAQGVDSHAEGSYTVAYANTSHAAGQRSRSHLKYSRATAGNRFSTNGDGQNIEVNCGTATIDATPKELSLDYTFFLSDIEMRADSVWGFTVRVVGKSDDGNSLFAILEGMVEYDGTNVTLIGASSPLAPRFQTNTPGAAAWNVEIQNHVSDNDFLIVVTGAAALPIFWVAQIQATEVILPAGPGPV